MEKEIHIGVQSLLEKSMTLVAAVRKRDIQTGLLQFFPLYKRVVCVIKQSYLKEIGLVYVDVIHGSRQSM